MLKNHLKSEWFHQTSKHALYKQTAHISRHALHRYSNESQVRNPVSVLSWCLKRCERWMMDRVIKVFILFLAFSFSLFLSSLQYIRSNGGCACCYWRFIYRVQYVFSGTNVSRGAGIDKLATGTLPGNYIPVLLYHVQPTAHYKWIIWGHQPCFRSSASGKDMSLQHICGSSLCKDCLQRFNTFGGPRFYCLCLFCSNKFISVDWTVSENWLKPFLENTLLFLLVLINNLCLFFHFFETIKMEITLCICVCVCVRAHVRVCVCFSIMLSWHSTTITVSSPLTDTNSSLTLTLSLPLIETEWVFWVGVLENILCWLCWTKRQKKRVKIW